MLSHICSHSPSCRGHPPLPPLHVCIKMGCQKQWIIGMPGTTWCDNFLLSASQVPASLAAAWADGTRDCRGYTPAVLLESIMDQTQQVTRQCHHVAQRFLETWDFASGNSKRAACVEEGSALSGGDREDPKGPTWSSWTQTMFFFFLLHQGYTFSSTSRSARGAESA